MPPTTAVTDWGMATWTAFTAGLAAFYGFVPNLLGAALILLLGWAIATLLYSLTDRVLDTLGFDGLMTRTGLASAIDRSGVHVDPSNLVAALAKWTVLLVSFMMAADALNLAQVSMGIGAILAYVPNVIAAVAILTLGLLLAGFVARFVRGAAATAGLKTSDMLADLSYWAIAVFASLGAIGQLNIAPTLVQTLYTAVVAAVALAAALAFGLGMRNQARDVVAGRAIAESLHPGDDILVEDVRGRVQAIGAIKTLVMTQEGMVSVPNHVLAERTFRVGGGMRMAGAMGGGGGPAEVKHRATHVITPDEARQEHAKPSWLEDPRG